LFEATMRITVLVAMFMLAAVPRTASAVTLDEIVSLSKAGVSDQVILALIERDQPSVDISADQLLALKNDGVSETVVLSLLRSGRQQLSSVAAAGDDVAQVSQGLEIAPAVQPYTAPYPVAYPVVYPVIYPVLYTTYGRGGHTA